MDNSDKSRRNRNLKTGINRDDARKKREEAVNDIRKAKREEQIAKRRVAADGAVARDLPQENRQRDPVIDDKLQALPQLVAAVHSNDPKLVVEAVTHFRKLLSIERDPPIQEVIDSGVVPRLVEFLTVANNNTLQFEAAWALTNIASGTSRHTRVVIQHGAIPQFVNLLRSQHGDVREQAVWALGNIAGDSTECRDLVLRTGALPPLLALCQPNAKLSLLRNATWTISNFCRGKPQPPFELVSPALPILASLVTLQDEEVLTDACWALSYLSDDTGPNNQKIQAVIQSGVCRRLVELLMHRSANVKTPALRTVGNIVTGDDLQTQTVLNSGALNTLAQLLTSNKRGIRKEACWTISNITAGNPDQIKAVIDANIFPPLVQVLREAEFDIKKEAAWAISNATSGGTDEQLRYLVNQGVIPPLCALFKCPDPKVILVALEGVENILRVGGRDAAKTGSNKFSEFVEECGGLDSLEELQKHQNEKIYDKVVKILTTYFDGEEEEDVSIAPVSDDNQFQFQPQNPGNNNFQF